MQIIEPRFRWTCSYMGRRWYDVDDETGHYSIEERYEASDYERSISSYDDAGWQREIVNAIGRIRRAYNSINPVPAATVVAFNAWRLANHNEQIAKMDSQPERYDFPADDPIRIPPQVVQGMIWNAEHGFMELS